MFIRTLNKSCISENASTPFATPTPAPIERVGVKAELSTKTPKSQKIPSNAYQVPFLAIDITAPNEDILLVGVEVQYSGLGLPDNIKNVQIFDGVTPKGNDSNFLEPDSIAILNLKSDPFVIRSQTIKTFYVRADIDAETITLPDHILSVINLSFEGKSSKNTFFLDSDLPIVGNKMIISN